MRITALALAMALGTSAVARAEAPEQIVNELKLEGIRKGWTFDVGVTPMTGRSDFGYREDHALESEAQWLVPPVVQDLPARFDWRDQGVVGPVRDQAQPVYCGSCWAHGTTAAFESAIAIRTGTLPDVSPQQLVSCSPSYGTCNGGNFAFGFYRQVGANHEVDFPYAARDVACNTSAAKHEKAATWGYVGQSGRQPTIDELKRAIFTYGPVAVTVSSSRAWSSYTGGIYNACDSQTINHIVALVGWDDADQVWIVKNSHGTQFGEQGYMRSKWFGADGRKCNGLGQSAAWVVPAM